MDSVSVNIQGLDELIEKLNSVSYDMKRKGGRAALRKAAKVISDAAKRGAEAINRSETSNSIPANIRIQWGNRTFNRTGDLLFRVGVDGGAAYKAGNKNASRPGGDTFYWRFLEFGTQKIAAIPFMRPALEENTAKALDTFVVEYKKYIDRAIKRGKS